ncbi:MAG TPA: HAD-IIIA family hydrolase [Anaerolineae bacterium]|jgi:D-glycero-D-manno-heptose 1,7-bisphosphate phosphatase|nr:HAD-IIIA family hydrolase [Anaerolineae bacterium]
MYPAVFLDRDGVIIENRANYVRSWSDVSIYPQALSALAKLSHAPYRTVIVTNQSAVGRGLITLNDAEAINERLVQEISRAGGRIDRVYMCPHAPEAGCDCRKPKPGLLLSAQRELSLDMSRSLLIGDALSDLFAGDAACVPQVALVRTGRGATQAQLPAASSLGSLNIYDTLSSALVDLL